ncbi:Oidioi.mRNA.OKI2018_I69.chr2.g6042.t1.cds [Oikopleura dioica]|uniref:Oidioi.mRNA.OKI2018_I69.chr2.g6042.t1.cds n=1 Tax=Oikopleura dioica TaxID=34765 RepID=A0ABN7T1T8_OIKDI|nr:Oidioi.mRNA.OKI2018_I69.chr2.g6042.t1.cds [Oikopleura dioica]
MDFWKDKVTCEFREDTRHFTKPIGHCKMKKSFVHTILWIVVGLVALLLCICACCFGACKFLDTIPFFRKRQNRIDMVYLS